MKSKYADEWIEGWGELSLYTQIPVRTLRRHADRQAFRVIRLSGEGGPVRFIRSEVDQWLQSIVGRTAHA